jgi:L-serine dehydratase
MDRLSLGMWIEDALNVSETFGQYCLQLQATELEINKSTLLDRTQTSLAVMREAIAHGLTGVRSTGGLAGGDGRRLQQWHAGKRSPALLGNIAAKAAEYALAANEANAAMGRICAAPTAGSSGILPAVLFSLAEKYNYPDDQLCSAVIAAGSIGMVIASRASLAGAEGGCQAECGSAAAMAAGAAVDLLGGTPTQVGHAVALALKNLLGLVCDPVAGLVEVPCVKRNAGGAMIALLATDMALAGIQSVIPVDEVIDAMASVGRLMAPELRETALGGLAATPTGIVWAEKILGPKERSSE